MTVRVVIADDHPLMLAGIAALFADPRFVVLDTCRDGLAARRVLTEQAVDLAVLDINMPGLSGIDLLEEARTKRWKVKIVLLTAGTDVEQLARAIELGVDGLVLKHAVGDMLLRAVDGALAGLPWLDREAMQQVLTRPKAEVRPGLALLTARETDVARLVALGMRNKEIAHQLGIGEGTVKMHLHNLYEKLGIGSRTELALLAREQGLDTP